MSGSEGWKFASKKRGGDAGDAASKAGSRNEWLIINDSSSSLASTRVTM